MIKYSRILTEKRREFVSKLVADVGKNTVRFITGELFL